MPGRAGTMCSGPGDRARDGRNAEIPRRRRHGRRRRTEIYASAGSPDAAEADSAGTRVNGTGTAGSALRTISA
ncbi:hypothetical protein Mth01_07580 [Sphaerimonospora thailandensis]|uniref:Uncharacterized protein n=1 Tax=Sphaerimonospora thailandensis TaxID=795644 RepID=A0A8J3R658_9ACTN|nr:hypothetical protein Mth01_07580 [Sphaerimonospora thailandensis]